MAKKLSINITQENLDKLYKGLRAGSPITIALQYAGIAPATYYYWVAVYSVVLAAKQTEELQQIEKIASSGISIEQIKETAAANTVTRKGAMGGFIEPSMDSILRYKKSKRFKEYADQVYEIINECNQIRAEVTLSHLATITKSTQDKRINASGSMWWLERTQPDFFAKPTDKVKEEENAPTPVERVQVEFIDSSTKENKDRIRHMEELVR